MSIQSTPNFLEKSQLPSWLGLISTLTSNSQPKHILQINLNQRPYTADYNSILKDILDFKSVHIVC